MAKQRMRKLKAKQLKRETAVDKKRNAARLSYPVDVRIDLAMKHGKSNQE